MARTCTHCAADISSRDVRAIQCFACLYGWGRRVGAAFAYRAVHRAINSGILAKASELHCVDCGGRARDYDHRDYGKPLDVQPVCRSCNKLRGPAIRPDVFARAELIGTPGAPATPEKAVANV